MREVFIITREGNHVSYIIPNIPEDASKEEMKDLKYAHETYFKKYIEENNIDVNTEGKTSYGIAEELMLVGLSPIIVENREMFVFIPEKMTKEQYNWYKKMIPVLKRFNIHFSYVENDNINSVDIEDDEPSNQNLKRFYKIIDKNIKKQKESEIYGHNKLS